MAVPADRELRLQMLHDAAQDRALLASFHVCLVGAPAVGKTTLHQRFGSTKTLARVFVTDATLPVFIEERPHAHVVDNESHTPAPGANADSESLLKATRVKVRAVDVLDFDQVVKDGSTPVFGEKGRCFVLIYDVTRRETYNFLLESVVPILCRRRESCHVILLANFTDKTTPCAFEAAVSRMQDITDSDTDDDVAVRDKRAAPGATAVKREVSADEGAWLARDLNADYVEISASTCSDAQVADVLRVAANRWLNNELRRSGVLTTHRVVTPTVDGVISPAESMYESCRLLNKRVANGHIAARPGAVRLPLPTPRQDETL